LLSSLREDALAGEQVDDPPPVVGLPDGSYPVEELTNEQFISLRWYLGRQTRLLAHAGSAYISPEMARSVVSASEPTIQRWAEEDALWLGLEGTTDRRTLDG
jgi:hypothetical protein